MNIIKEGTLFRMVKLADIFTFGNLASGLLSIFFIINNQLLIGSILIIAAVVFDFLDGRIARLMKTENLFGKELDSLCDMVSFGIAPAVLVFSQASSPGYIILYVIFACAGAFRLARFNIIKTKGFIGMPITINGILFPILYLISTPLWIVHIVMAATSYLMASSIRFRKL